MVHRGSFFTFQLLPAAPRPAAATANPAAASVLRGAECALVGAVTADREKRQAFGDRDEIVVPVIGTPVPILIRFV